jgi:hypothetical protein
VDERDAYVPEWKKQAVSWRMSNPLVAEFEAKAKG